MNNERKMSVKVILKALTVLVISMSISVGAYARENASENDSAIEKIHASKVDGYVATNESIGGYFSALSSKLNKPIILSKLALRKKISGEVSLVDPQLQLELMSNNLGLIWYDNNSTLYVYDATEMASQIIKMKAISLDYLLAYLKRIGVYDSKYPLRGEEGNSTFFISGPPIYVELINELAQTLDNQDPELESGETVSIVYLQNTFAEDRVYSFRDQKLVVPGIATVLGQLFTQADVKSVKLDKSVYGNINGISGNIEEANNLPDAGMPKPLQPQEYVNPAQDAGQTNYSDVKIISNPGNNSLLLKASEKQILHIKNIIAALDKPRRHIELSVWIVDLEKSALEQLGTNWNGGLHIGNKLGISLNQGVGGTGSMINMSSTLDGGQFMADILALSKNKLANIISRPVILTQENIPAIFDNSHSIYTQLLGEHNVDLQKITFGTAVSVLPRFTQNDEIEMMLNVEDGNANETSGGSDSLIAPLPQIARTNISTVARVPRGKSLLIGGYTRDEDSKNYTSIPLLGKIPFIGALFRYRITQNTQTVRVFLIQPREIKSQDIAPENSLSRDLFSSTPLRDWKQNLSMSFL
ncbi:type III secretion system outer membrane ring subunit SctC [Rouxiella sp. T17]|uniref:type III secretion system outer membrane ring subunit SctC n=1 Tax=Rouxiella sp. T17 TaxID=3085684 RepID=UPI002FC6F72E